RCPRTLRSCPTRRSSDLTPASPEGSGSWCWLDRRRPSPLQCAMSQAAAVVETGGMVAPSLVELELVMSLAVSSVPKSKTNVAARSEEHTSELQSRVELGC